MTLSTIKPISEITTKGLHNLENNYLRLNKTEGGKYSLVEVRREMQRRNGGKFHGETVFNAISSLSQISDTGFISYADLFNKLHQKPWIGNGCQMLVKKDLSAATYYCVTNNLPLVSTIVIRKNATQLTDQAMKNILGCAKELGVKDLPPCAKRYVTSQQVLCFKLIKARSSQNKEN